MNSSINNMIICPTILKGMSHEMRTHMNEIVAYSFLMKDNVCKNSDREAFGNHIFSSCEKLIGLFDSFLDSALMELENCKVELKVCQPGKIFEDICSEFREILNNEPLKELELVTGVKYNCSSEILLDNIRLLKVLRCLFQNAVKNTKSGYIKIGYSQLDNLITFYLIDSGDGYLKYKEFIESEDLNKSLVKYNDTFSAVNIILAKKLIDSLNGNMWIECNGLTGSAIYFSVPAEIVIGSSIIINQYENSVRSA